MGLPINFEEKAKQPPNVGGVGGYPYSISAKDLNKNFVYASVVIPSASNGITETTKTGEFGHKTRELTTVPMQKGINNGDMLYWNGSEWAVLAAPSGSSTYVLTHDGTTPTWSETEECP